MRFIRYGKYTGEPADAIDLEQLVNRLGNFFCKAALNRNSTVSLRWILSALWKRSAKPFFGRFRKATCSPKTP